MPDLATLTLPKSLTLIQCPMAKPMSSDSANEPKLDDSAVKPALTTSDSPKAEEAPVSGNGNVARVFKRSRGSSGRGKKVECLSPSAQNMTDLGVSQLNSIISSFAGAKNMGECLFCRKYIYHGQEVVCSVPSCQRVYHSICAKERRGITCLKKFKCPLHACYVCDHRPHWICIRCPVAFHDKCAAWPDKVIHLKDQPGRAICWRHPEDWRFDNKNEEHEATDNIAEIFSNLPLPYVDEEFKIDFTAEDQKENKVDPPPYVHIKRNIYLVKKKRDHIGGDTGCSNCSDCSEGCLCRVQCISCSKSCGCSEACTNRPFRKEKKIHIVKTESCGWGVEAAEPISKRDFIIEYVGEVIDDAQCEERLWDMKHRGEQNFYMCELQRDFTIDATFKGNASRFLNHSCDPNCHLEKWQVDGETRVGVFAARCIEAGEPLTYNYRFVLFGRQVECHCGASNCQGYLGAKKTTDSRWGSRRKRTNRQKSAAVNV